MHSKNRKTSDPQRLLLNYSDKIDFKKVLNIFFYQFLAFTINGKILKSHTKTMNLKYSNEEF